MAEVETEVEVEVEVEGGGGGGGRGERGEIKLIFFRKIKISGPNQIVTSGKSVLANPSLPFC